MVLGIILVMTLAGTAVGQVYTVSGTVYSLEQSTGVRVPDVRVDVDSSSEVTFTNSNGAYSISGIAPGSHIIRVSAPGYKGFWMPITVSGNTVANASLPANVQTVPMGTDSLNVAKFDEMYKQSMGINDSSDPLYWYKMIDGEGDVPVSLVNADGSPASSRDSSLVMKAYGIGQWTSTSDTSLASRVKRNLFAWAPMQAALDSGIVFYFNYSGLDHTSGLTYTGSDGNIYFLNAQSYIHTLNDSLRIVRHEGFRAVGAGTVTSYYSVMNTQTQTLPDMQLIDNVNMWVYLNHGAARYRGEASFPLSNMFEYSAPSVPGVVALVSPAINSTGVDSSASFSWKNVFGTDDYELQIAKDSNFTDIVADTLLGRISASKTLNSDTQYFWRVRSKNSAGTGSWSSVFSFTTQPPVPAAPVVSSPASGSVNQPVNVAVSWNPVSNADKYALVVSEDSLFNSVDLDTLLSGTSVSLKNLKNSTKYFLKLDASNSTGTSVWSYSHFTTIVALPGLPGQLSPANYSTNQPLSVMLEWVKGSNADSTEVELSQDSTFATSKLDTVVANSSASASGLAFSSKYFWRSRSKNLAGKSNWTSAWSFTTQPPLPAAPVVSSPASGSVNQPVDVSVSWGAVSNASSYALVVSEDSLFNSVDLDTLLSGTSVSLKNLKNSTKYFLKLDASNSTGTSAWSYSHFTTIVALPGIPTQLSPVNYSSNQPLSLTLQWVKGSNADSTEVELSQDSTFATSKLDTVVANSSASASGLAFSSKYFWRSRSKNVAGNSSWTGAWSFTTSAVPVPYISKLLADTTVDENSGSSVLSSDVTKNITSTQPMSYAVSGSKELNVELRNDSLIITPAANYYGNNMIVVLTGTNNYGSISDTAIVSVAKVDYTPTTPLFTSPKDSASNPVTFDWKKSTDQNNSTMLYTFSLQGTGFDSTKTTADTSEAFDALKRGHYLATVSASNGKKTSKVDSISVYVRNNAPVGFDLESMTDSLHNKSDDVVVKYSRATDIDGDSLTYGIIVKNSSDSLIAMATSQDTSSVSIAGSLFKSGNYTVSGWVTDGFDTVYSPKTLNDLVTGVHDDPNIPTKFVLFQNYPNPFNPSTTIEYQVPKPGMVTLDVYNILGERVMNLVNKIVPAGDYRVILDASGLASGVYFYRLESGEYVQTMKFILLK